MTGHKIKKRQNPDLILFKTMADPLPWYSVFLFLVRPNPKKNIVYSMGHYPGVDYNLTLCPLQSRLQHIYHGQPYARVDFIPQSGI